jgi:hypothetical protein
MIDIREIRIGNCFNLKNKKEIIFVDSILSLDNEILYSTWHDEKHSYVDISYLLPIRITEDLLLQLGFSSEHCFPFNQNNEKEFYIYMPNGFRLDINSYSNTLGRDYYIHIDNLCCDSILSGDIQYLNQLQNYIYDATKQELEITNIL